MGILIFGMFSEIHSSLCVCRLYICIYLTSVGVLVECQMNWHTVENEIVLVILTSIHK